MAAGDMGWSDCGRTSDAQFFYGKKQGRKQVGRCGRYETRTALYAGRLEKRWKYLFKLKFDREPSSEELWAVLRTGEIAVNVKMWEKEYLKDEKRPPKRAHIHRGSGGRRMTRIMGDWIKDENNRREAVIMARLEEEEKLRIKSIDRARRMLILEDAEVPKGILISIFTNKISIDDVCTVFGVDAQRIDDLIEAWGLKDKQNGQEKQEE
jgi:hypothetical protein